MFTLVMLVLAVLLWTVGTSLLSVTSTEGKFIASVGFLCGLFAFVSMFG